MTEPLNLNADEVVLNEDEAQAALQQLRAKLLSLPADVLAPVRVSTPRAVAAVLRVAAAYRVDRARFAAVFTLEGLDLQALDDLELRGLAFWQADLEYRLAVDPEGTLQPLLALGIPLRRKLLKAALYLWSDDRALHAIVLTIQDGRGYLDTARDLSALGALFEEQWPHIQGRCQVTQQDLRQAQRLGVGLLRVLQPSKPTEDLRARRDLFERAAAYALNGVQDVRAAAAYVFRRQPERLADYPSPFSQPARPARRTAAAAVPAPVAEPTGDVERPE